MTTRFEWKHGGHHVLLAGSFTAWKAYPLTQSNGVWFDELPLPTGTHRYKFVVDGEWRVDEEQPKSGKLPHVNNVVHVTKGFSKKQNATKARSSTRVGQVVVVENSEECAKVLEEGGAVKFGEVLERLYLSAAMLNEHQGNLLLEALKSKNSLTTLNLSHNKLGDTFLVHLSSLLNSTSLKELYLWSTDITDGVLPLATSLATNTTLTTLQLRGNGIGHDGARALAQALKTNKTLEVLDLWYNPIGEEGLESLAHAIGAHGSLKEVHLGEGAIVTKKSARDALVKALKGNKSLQVVHLFTNDRRPFTETLTELQREIK